MKKSNLLILGAGQYSFVAEDTANAMGCFDRIAYLDDASPRAIGKLAEFAAFRQEFSHAFVAMGKPALRQEYLNRIRAAGFTPATLIHPTAVVSPLARIGPGTIVEPLAVVNANAEVGEGCLICAGAVVNHNARLGNCCQIDCNATVPARSQVPDGTGVPCGSVWKE